MYYWLTHIWVKECLIYLQTILLQDKQNKYYCVACQELNSDIDKDNPGTFKCSMWIIYEYVVLCISVDLLNFSSSIKRPGCLVTGTRASTCNSGSPWN